MRVQRRRESNLPAMINVSMIPGGYEDWQHFSINSLDRVLFTAYTCGTRSDSEMCVSELGDAMGQCLRHANFLSGIEGFYRSVQNKLHFDHNEIAFNEVISFLLGVGETITRVRHQLDFASAGMTETIQALGPSAPDRQPPKIEITLCSENNPLAHVRFPSANIDLRECDLRLWAEEFLRAADEAGEESRSQAA